MFDLIEQEPARLREVTGIGPKRAGRIVAGWAEQKVIREIMLFLDAHGVGTSRAVRIYKTYGQDAVRDIGFLGASKVAARPREGGAGPGARRPLPSRSPWRWTRATAGCSWTSDQPGRAG